MRLQDILEIYLKKDDIKIYSLWKDHKDWNKLLPELNDKIEDKDRIEAYIINKEKKDK